MADVNQIEEKKNVFSVDALLNKIASRRKFIIRLSWAGIIAFLLGNLIAFIRFFYPRVLFELPSLVKVGKPSEYHLGVEGKKIIPKKVVLEFIRLMKMVA